MHRNRALGALAGMAGGLAGSWMMVRFNHLVNHDEEPGRRDRHPQYRQSAKPNDTDGTIPDEPASIGAAATIAEGITGRPLPEDARRTAGSLGHYAFGAVAGAFYGASAETEPSTTVGFGLPYGAAIWATAVEIGVPLSGLSEPPTAYPISRHAASLGSHLVYGATLEAVRRLLRGRPATPEHARSRAL